MVSVAKLLVGILTLLIVVFLESVVIVWNRKTIINKIKLFFGKSKGYGKVKLLMPNFRFKEYVKKFGDNFEINGIVYRFDPKRVYLDEEGTPCIFYRYKDTEPLDLRQEDIPIIDGEFYAIELNKAEAAGRQKAGEKTVTDVLLILVLLLVVVSLFLTYTNYQHIHDLLTQVKP